jgi:tetratricopeptide (TPR) repeat protein
MACALPLIVVFATFEVLSKTNENPEDAATQHLENIRSTEAINDVNGKDKENIKSTQTISAEIEKAAPDQGTIENTARTGGVQRHPSGLGRDDPFADIYNSIAKKFAEQQLWQIALEYYHRVFKKNSEFPELSAKIAEMKSEIQNQTLYEKGQALIKNDRYEKGIAKLHAVADNSFYFHKAAQAITAAREKMAQQIDK